jgi:UDP-N-acetylmuramate dehydrogenase
VSLDDLCRRLRETTRGRVEANRPLRSLTTYRLGGPARLYVEPADVADLGALWAALREAGDVELLLLGRGSNLVVSDRGWPGVVVRLGPGFSWIEPWREEGQEGLRAGAATPLPTLANWAARRGLSGLEWLVAIPGSVGGAVRMNAGAHDGAVATRLHSMRSFDLGRGELASRAASALGLAYRRSGVTERELVLEASFSLAPADPDCIRATMDRYRRHRAATQPGALQNAGSTFRNPPGDSAGRLVEAAGLKGFRIGGALVSELHANFFMASEGATSQDVYDLVAAVRAQVRARFGVDLEPEVRFAGSFESPARRDREAGRR